MIRRPPAQVIATATAKSRTAALRRESVRPLSPAFDPRRCRAGANSSFSRRTVYAPQNRKSARDHDGLADAARGRSQADWLVGMNLSRAYSIGKDSLYSVGRVQTPTLALVVEREKEIRAFVPESYFEVAARFGPAVGQNEGNSDVYEGTYTEHLAGDGTNGELLAGRSKTTRQNLVADRTTAQIGGFRPQILPPGILSLHSGRRARGSSLAPRYHYDALLAILWSLTHLELSGSPMVEIGTTTCASHTYYSDCATIGSRGRTLPGIRFERGHVLGQDYVQDAVHSGGYLSYGYTDIPP